MLVAVFQSGRETSSTAQLQKTPSKQENAAKAHKTEGEKTKSHKIQQKCFWRDINVLEQLRFMTGTKICKGPHFDTLKEMEDSSVF